jgi:hypothetical protein
MRFFLFFLMCFFGCSESFSTNYYVSATGSNSDNGLSPSSPWQTISKVNTINFAPGDSLFFNGGDTFTGSIYLDNQDGNNDLNIFTISSYGNGRAIIDGANGNAISAYNTEGFRIQNLIFTGSGMGTNTAHGVEIYADLPGNVKLKGISLDNLEVRYFGKTGVMIGSWNGNTGYENLVLNNLVVHDNLWDGILVYGNFSTVGYPHHNVMVTNCESYNNPGIADPNNIRGNGIIVSNTDGALIENCIAHGNGSSNIHCGGPGGIWTYDCNNIIIQYCESYNNHSGSACDGLGFDLDGGTINSIMQYNYSHDNDGGGFLMGQMLNGRPWKNNICRYNISENDARTNAAGITLFKEGSTTIMDSVYIYNNTVFISPAAINSSESAFRVTQWYTGINHVMAYNNIFITMGGVPLVDVPVGYSAYLAGNLYWSSGAPFIINYQGTTYNTLSSWRNATNNELLNGNPTGLDTDPILSNVGAGGTLNPASTYSLNAYKLLNNSPAIDAGLNLDSLFNINAGPVDYWGNTIPAGLAADIGANEAAFLTSILKTNSDQIGIIIYPNPTNGKFTVLTGKTNSVEVFNVLGEKIFNAIINGGTADINLSDIPKGIYFVRLTYNEGRYQTEKIIIQ